MKFKSDIELQSGLRDGSNDIGTAGQILSSTGSQTNWIDQDSIVASEAKLVVIECKNTSGVTISKGTPVYQTGTVGATDVIEVDVADASDEDKMAAIGLLQTDIANNAFGKVVITGELLNITTSPIDGVTPVTGDTIYVKSGGGLTLTKPTGVNFIQNIGLVGKVSGGNSGSITVSSIMRSNDVPTPLYIDHTNQRLGIGTTSPSEKLVVQDGNLIVSGSSSELAIGPVAGKSRIFTNSSKDIRFSTAITNDAVFIKNNNGNVGIGTTSPNAKLHIGPSTLISGYTPDRSTLAISDTTNGGQLIIRGQSPRIWFDATAGGNAELFLDGSKLNILSGAPTSTGSSRFYIKADGNVGIGTTTPARKLEVDFTGSVFGARFTRSDATGSSTIEFANSAGVKSIIGYDAGVDGYKIGTTSATNFVVKQAGNVGIGTTSPTFKLHVNSTDASDNVAYIHHNNAAQSSGDVLKVRSDAGDNAGSALLNVANNTGSALYVRGDRNVGIGTTNPGAKLDIINSGLGTMFRLSNTEANATTKYGAILGRHYTNAEENVTGMLITSSSSATGGTVSIGGGISASNAVNNVLFYTAANNTTLVGTERMRINSSGNVGIGTTAPGAKLDIIGSSIGLRIKKGDLSDVLRVYSQGSGIYMDNGDVHISDNLGIGTTTPNRKLSVYQSSSSLVADFRSASGNNSYISFSNNASTADQVRIGSASGSLVLMTSYNERVRVTSNGNVGIGTTSPSNKLTIGQAVDDNGLKILGYDDESGSSVSLSVSSAGHARLSQTTDGSSGYLFLQAENYLQLIAGTFIYTTSTFRVYDNTQLQFGNSGDYKIYYSTSADNLYIHTDDNKGINVSNTGGVQFNTYGAGTLVTDASGNITVSSGGGAGGPYLPLAGGTMTGTNGVLMPDNFKLNLGTGSDLQIYHDGSNSYIKDTGTGNLRIRSTSLRLEGTDSSNMLVGSEGDSVSLYFNNSKKFETSNTGVSVTGNGIFTGNVGIGTTSPSEKLDVYGNAIVRGDIVARDTYPSIYVNHSGTAMGGIRSDATNKLELKTLTTAPLSFQVNSSEKMRINSSGNVGIGTTSPNHKLDVNGGAQFNTNTGATPFYITRLGGTSQALSIKVMDDNVRFESIQDETADDYGGFDFRMDGGTTEPDFVVRKNAGNPILNVKGNGNVGIGTASPSNELEILGGGSPRISLRTTSETVGEALELGFQVGTSANSSTNSVGIIKSVITQANPSALKGDLVFQTNSGDSVNTKMVIKDSGNVGIGTTSPGHKLSVIGGHIQTDGNVYTNVIRDNTGGNVSIQDNGGNVGIGTTSPISSLDVNGTISLSGETENKLYKASTSPVTGVVTNTTVLQGRQIDLYALDDIVLRTGTSASDDIIFFAGNSEKARIKGSGNVGIGTTGPSSKLQVEAAAGQATTLNNSVANSALRINADTANGSNNIRIGESGSGSYFLQVSNSAGTTPYAINLNPFGGNVGIGTTSPGSKLEVSSGVGANGDSILTISADTDNSNNSSSPKLLMLQKGSTKTSLIEMDSSDRTHFSNATGYYFSGGNVGIGTTSPSYKLDVDGVVRGDRFFVGTNTAASQWAFHARNNNSTADSGLYFNNNSSEIYLRNSSNVIGARIRSNSASYFNGGDVGIGTASPQERLHVSGETHPSIKLSSSSDGNYNVILNCGYRNEALNLSVGGYKVFTTEGFNTPETTHLYSNNSKALSLASNQAATFTSTVTATNFINSSDERLKENIEEVCNNNVEVNWKTFNFKTEKEQKRYGVIAQELEKTNPEFVREDSKGFKSVAYIDLLIAKIAELEARIQKLENK